MMVDGPPVPAAECRSREALAAHQAERLGRLLHSINGRNQFYTRKLAEAGINPGDLLFPRDLDALPVTTKTELMADQDAAPPWGTVLTEPLDRYTRYNQTSSTTGRPLRWLDTTESWQWMLECWKAVYRSARVRARDRIFFPFSFGPFLGFWTAFEAGTQIGAHCVPAGGMTSEARLALIEVVKPTVICCTPTYALRLLEVAWDTRGTDATLVDSTVRVLIVAGEPGGSIAPTREQIEHGWGARVIDHHGMTEVGPISFECWENPGGVHLNECEFICEVLNPETGRRTPPGRQGELVITNLGRAASPLIRYRTGDLVVVSDERCACGRTLARLEGGDPVAHRRHGLRKRRQRISSRDRGRASGSRRGGRVSGDDRVPRCVANAGPGDRTGLVGSAFRRRLSPNRAQAARGPRPDRPGHGSRGRDPTPLRHEGQAIRRSTVGAFARCGEKTGNSSQGFHV